MRGPPYPAAAAVTSPEARRGRALVDRLAVRVPGLARALTAAVLRLPRSRLRTALATWALQRGYAAFNRRDWECNTVLHHPTDHTWDARNAGPVPMDVTYSRGIEGYVEGMMRYLEPWQDLRLDVEDVIEIGSDRLLVLLLQRGTGAGSGVPVELLTMDLLTFRDGWLIGQRVNADPAAAFREVGLSPPERIARRSAG